MEVVEEQIIKSDILRYDEKKFPRKPSLIPIPEDKFKLGYIFFFFMGLCHLMPIVFFSSANNFWMHKFRDPLQDDYNTTTAASNRTSLQKYFASASQIANTAPSLIFGLFNILVAFRYSITSRVSITLAIQTLTFIIFTVSVKLNTDNYQGVFFASVMLGYIFLSSSGSVNMVSSMSLYSRFPHEYMICCLIGEGVSGVAGDLINIICIACFNGDIIASTLVYFIFGTSVLFITFVLSVFEVKTAFFQHCLHSVPQEKNKIPSKQELLNVFYKIRIMLLLIAFFTIGLSATHTSITALVVSEQTDTSWAKNYFSPTMTFFLGDFCLLIGRLISSFIPIKISENVLLILTIIRTVAMVPMVWLCNAQPRTHLPVVFGRDFEYGLIFGLFMCTNGYILNYAAVYIPQKLEKNEADVAYTLFGLLMSIISTAASPIGMFIVNIL